MKLDKMIISMLACIFVVSCSVFQGKSSASEYVDDAKITAKIKAKYVQTDAVPATAISVETQDGIVQLGGFVTNDSQIKEAVRIARSVSGVRDVENNLIASQKRKR